MTRGTTGEASPRKGLASRKDSTPENIWDALRRIRNCNRQQLAARLGIDAKTLRRWEADTEAGRDPGTNAHRAAADLIRSTLRAANHADRYTDPATTWTAPKGQNQ